MNYRDIATQMLQGEELPRGENANLFIEFLDELDRLVKKVGLAEMSGVTSRQVIALAYMVWLLIQLIAGGSED